MGIKKAQVRTEHYPLLRFVDFSTDYLAGANMRIIFETAK